MRKTCDHVWRSSCPVCVIYFREREEFIGKLGDLAREVNDDIIGAYANMLRTTGAEPHDVVFMLVRALAENRRHIFDALQYATERTINPPVILRDINTGKFVNPKPAQIYFVDFLRSWWRRLTGAAPEA